MIRVVRHLFLLGALALLALPATAQASAVTDCARDNDLDKQYTRSELREALDELPTDSDEYGLCREVIAGAIHSGSDKGGGRPSATGDDGGALPADEQTRRGNDADELARIAGDGDADARPPSVEVGGEQVQPGSDGLYDVASASNGLPTPLLLALIAIGLLAITGVLVALRSRVPLLARLPLLSKIPAPRAPSPRPSRR